jgi:hypothetical protein
MEMPNGKLCPQARKRCASGDMEFKTKLIVVQ